MNAKIRKQIERRKRRIARRLDKDDNRGCERPMMTAANIHYEIAGRTRATANGGIGAIHLLVKKLGLDRAIDGCLNLLKIHLPYHDSDHVLNIAYNLLAGGTCLEHLELLRCDEAYLDALGARRVPDPTTAGDFCRRFDAMAIFRLQQVFNATRIKVWRQQPESFFEEAILDADGTMAETTGECKQGMDINHKGQWGYHPLVLSLANTAEPLFVVNRSGNRPSHEQAAYYFDRAKHEVKTRPRRRPENVKQQVVEAREFEDIRLVQEHVAEFRYRPAKCKKEYRVVVVWKELDVYRGQKRLFDDARCFFYLTNDWDKPAEEIVFEANRRCNQENLLAQLKGGVRSLVAPVDNLLSNWAYMVMASLAWSLKAWSAPILPEDGRWQEKHRAEKGKLLRMDFTTFRCAMMKVPAQILSTGRKIVYRLLGWNPWQHVFFRLLDQLRQPLRC